ncbi:hypothetical protein K469DRAFT_688019 [Zopfia rhizophila CBS 207.26]|uniref:DDE-1 domain-containing protein n=1 Tax=Zopfia rhizophila CBS 207.26 TaxID=1314779 RepID=A0A6A6E050_9PEZI|nr:hypothetical protein K469DRAFT_688019 [Zopfia rhizophila CBS 207.26]
MHAQKSIASYRRPTPPLGRDWVSRWLAQNPDVHKVKQKAKDKDRINAQKYEEIELHFEIFKRKIANSGILPDDIWNFDETGFRVGCGGNQIIITMGNEKSCTIGSKTNRDFLTSVEAISAAGEVIPPMLTLKGVNHLTQWHNRTHLSADYLMATSDSSYSNDQLAPKWIAHFEKHSAKPRKAHTGS